MELLRRTNAAPVDLETSSAHPASSSQYVLQQGETWLSCNAMGDIPLADGILYGLNHASRRYLSRFELFCDQSPPLLIQSGVDEANVLLTVELTNPAYYRRKQLLTPSGQLRIRRLMFLWQQRCYTRLVIENQSESVWERDCRFELDVDFLDVRVPLTEAATRPGRRLPPVSFRHQVQLGYEEINGTQCEMWIDFASAPADSSPSTIWVIKQLQPAQDVTFDLTITCDALASNASIRSFDQALEAARQAAQEEVASVYQDRTHI